MFADRLPGLVLLSLLAFPAWGFAGLYNPCEVDEGPFISKYYDQVLNRGFQTTLIKYRMIPIGQADMDKLVKGKDKVIDSPFRQRYQLVQDMASPDSAKLSPLQKLSLSEYLIRRRDPHNAWLLLRPLSTQPGDNFLILANLATACQQLAEGKKTSQEAADLYQQAIDYQSEAIRLWPREWLDLSPEQMSMVKNMQWTEETFSRCRQAEDYFLKLLRSRHRLARRGPVVLDSIDPLFVDKDGKPVSYVGDDGKFAPGKLAAVEKARLPEASIDKALTIVQQLIVWLPFDARLYWQLGELYNARGTPGDLRAAEKIFNDLDQNILDKNRKMDPDPVKICCQAFANFVIPEEKTNILPIEIGPDDKIKQKSDDYKPVDWRTIGVSFGFGLAVALFAQWQIREIRRRRQRV